jgi:predicted nucleic acid-binding protein
VRARKAGLIPSAAAVLDALAARGFRLSVEVRRLLLDQVGEA